MKTLMLHAVSLEEFDSGHKMRVNNFDSLATTKILIKSYKSDKKL